MVSFGHAAYLGIGGYAVGILAQGGHRLGLRAMAAGACRVGVVRAGGRRAVAAHARRLFHHDHARLRADGLLPRVRPRPLRRRRRPHHLQAQPVRRDLLNLLEQDAVLLSLPRAAARHDLSGLAADQFALRHGGPGRALQRARACARSAFRRTATSSPASSSPARFCGLSGALLANHADFNQPGDDVLDALGRPHRHGRARRHGDVVRPADRRR